MDYQYPNYQKKCKENREGRKKPVENRKPEFQQAEALAGKHRTRMQLERTGAKESLPDGTDRRFHKTAL